MRGKFFMFSVSLLVLSMLGIGGCAGNESGVEETPANTSSDAASEGPAPEDRYDDTTVIPQTFGAVGDGKNDDIYALRKAVKYAKDNGLTMTLPEAEYFISSPLALGDITVISENAKISYHGIHKSMPAVNMMDNSKVYGTLNIWSVDNEISNNGGRCGMLFGNYLSGEGVTNCYVEHVVITGGVPDGNGILITGDSNNITIDKVTVPAGTNITRAVLVHWGNATDHYVIKRGETYGHKDNWKPTTHPHDLHFGTIEATELIPSDASSTPTAPLCISAGYDITADELIGNKTDSVIVVLPGDIHFAYATEEEKAFGARNLVVNKAIGNGVRKTGIYALGYNNYLPDSDPLIDLTVHEAVIKGTGSNSYGTTLHKVAKAHIGSMTVSNCNASVVSLKAGCHNVTVDTLNVTDCNGQLVQVTSKSHERVAENLTIGTVNVSSCKSGGKSAMSFERIRGVHIGSMILEDSKYVTAMSLYSSAYDVRIDTLNAPSAFTMALVQAVDSISVVNNISFGKADYGKAPVSTGSDCIVKIGD